METGASKMEKEQPRGQEDTEGRKYVSRDREHANRMFFCGGEGLHAHSLPKHWNAVLPPREAASRRCITYAGNCVRLVEQPLASHLLTLIPCQLLFVVRYGRFSEGVG